MASNKYVMDGNLILDNSSILENKIDKGIVKTIINLALELDLVPVAEGVESIEHADCLEALGCDVFQGFFTANLFLHISLKRY